ncbi:MAG: DUF4190 domain-containing protein [Phycisphaerales bacterium]
MTDPTPPTTPTTTPPDHTPQGEPRPLSGLAITAFVLSIVSLCLSPLALVSLPLGIVGITKLNERSAQGGRGFAIAATCISAAGLLLSCVQIGIFLPALANARRAAIRLKDQTQMREIETAMMLYANENHDHLPGADEDWRRVLVDGGYLTDPEALESPASEPGQGESYYYVPSKLIMYDSTRVLLYTNPDLYDGEGGLIGYHDGHVEWVLNPTFEQIINSLTLPDGTPWAPHLHE